MGLQGYYCDDSFCMFSNDDNDPIFNNWVTYEDAEEIQADNVKLRDILQSLADIQNGPPLIKDTKKWNAIMERAYKILEGD